MSDATKVFRELIDAYDAGELALFADAVVRAREHLAAAPTPAQPAVEPVALPTRRYRLADDGWGLQLDPEGQYVHVHDLVAPPAPMRRMRCGSCWTKRATMC